MVISREKVIPQIDIKIDGERVEQVANFTYLGHWITEDGRSDQEVKRRIGMAKNTFSRMSKLLTNRRISFATRSRLTKCYVWSIFLYACETWTLNASLERNIERWKCGCTEEWPGSLGNRRKRTKRYWKK
ncbi:craniofacial development protein 2 [Elysia marginata]|uniref:Craniofacial development protein 2 n=1 Tax=Elysia marginata TaxID=1093978 RepID=A0AAV4JI05_9GAST|nr:craniofacial development protein 2 [Elysia marginata]